MLLILSVFFYIVVGLLLYSLGSREWVLTSQRYLRTGKYSKKWTSNTIIILTVLIVISALRYRVGVDCESYVDMLKQGPNHFQYDRVESLFRWFINFLRATVPSRYLYLGILAALEFIPFYYAFRTRKYLYPYFGLLFMMGPFYLIFQNGIRQAIAACFFVLASVLIVDGQKKQKLIAGILILIAAQIHTSAYALLVFLVLPVWDVFKSRYLCISLVVFCAIVGQAGGIISENLGFLANVEHDFFYGNYNVDLILASDSSMGFGPRRLIILSLSLLVIWFSSQMKEFYSDKFFVFSYNLFFLHVCLCENLLSNVSLMFRRPFYYTYPFEMISFAYLLYFLKKGYKGKNKKLFFIVTICMACMYIVIQCVADAGVNDETSLFKFYFLHQ